MKKTLAIVLVLIMCLCIFAGCASEKNTVANEEEWRALFSKEALGNVSVRFSSGDVLSAFWVNGDTIKYNYAVSSGMGNYYYEYKDGEMYAYALRDGSWYCSKIDMSDKGITDMHGMLLYSAALSGYPDMYDKAQFNSRKGIYEIETEDGIISVSLKNGRLKEIDIAGSGTIKFSDYGKTKVDLPENAIR